LSRAMMCVALAVAWCAPATAAPKAPSAKEVADAKALLQQVISPTPLKPEVHKRVKALLADLGDRAWSVRDAATKELIRVGPRAESLVHPAMKDEDLEVRTRADEILMAYKDAQSGRASRVAQAADLLARAKDPAAIDSLLALIDHGDSDIRHAVEYGLRRLTGKRFGFNAHDDDAKRAEPVKKWRTWWKGSRESFDFTPALERMQVVGVVVCDSIGREIFIMDLYGKKVFSKKVTQRPYCVAAAPNGNVLVGLYDKGVSRIEEYNRQGKKVWSSDKVNLRSVVQDVARLSNGNTLTTDPSGRRVIEIDPKGEKIVWSHQVNSTSPAAIQRLDNGNTLMCLYTGQVQEIDRKGKVVWERSGLSSPRDAQKLANGNVLITEYSRRRVVEITRGGKEVWQWTPSSAVRRPVSARRLPDGRTVVHVRSQGIVLLDAGGKIIKQLTTNVPRSSEKIRLVRSTGTADKTPTTKPAKKPSGKKKPKKIPTTKPTTKPAKEPSKKPPADPPVERLERAKRAAELKARIVAEIEARKAEKEAAAKRAAEIEARKAEEAAAAKRAAELKARKAALEAARQRGR